MSVKLAAFTESGHDQKLFDLQVEIFVKQHCYIPGLVHDSFGRIPVDWDVRKLNQYAGLREPKIFVV